MNIENWFWNLLFTLRIRRGYAVLIRNCFQWDADCRHYELNQEVSNYLADYSDWRIVSTTSSNLNDILTCNDHCFVFSSDRDAMLMVLVFDTTQPEEYSRFSDLITEHPTIIDQINQKIRYIMYITQYNIRFYRWIVLSNFEKIVDYFRK